MDEKIEENKELDLMILMKRLINAFERFNEHFSDFNDIIAPITGRRVVKEKEG